LQSSLLQAILRELPLSKGKITVNGVVSYASQEPWLFAGSVKQNILFGSAMDHERYEKVSICNNFLNVLSYNLINYYFLI